MTTILRITAGLMRHLTTVGVTLLLIGNSSYGFGLNAVDLNKKRPSDLATEPDNFYAWDKGTIFNPITYSFDASFLAAFPDPKQQEQVRLAFQEWTDASADGSRRRPEALYQWDRLTSPSQNFYDLRTLVTHELGHILGAGHPDAFWFNTNTSTSLPYRLNFRLDDSGSPVPAAPLGGEVMNEGNTPNYLPTSKPPKGFRLGEYNRKLSKDELALIDYAYGHRIQFQFVENPANADIVLTNFSSDNCGTQGTLGSGQVKDAEARNRNDLSKGGRILAGQMFLREICADRLGQPMLTFSPLSRYWEVTSQSSQNTVSVLMRTVGTDNLTPTSEDSTGAHRMTHYTNFLDVRADESLERILHQWSHPAGGPVPSGGTVRIALEQDVWDWEVEGARVITEDGAFAPAAFVNTLPFQLAAAQGSSGDGGARGTDQQMSVAAKKPRPVLSALRFTNGSSAPVSVEAVNLALLGKMSPKKVDSGLIRRLNADGSFERLELANGPLEFKLRAKDSFFVVVDGDVSYLPPEVLRRKSYFVIKRPETMNGPLVVAVTGSNEGTKVTSYALLNSGPYRP